MPQNPTLKEIYNNHPEAFTVTDVDGVREITVDLSLLGDDADTFKDLLAANLIHATHDGSSKLIFRKSKNNAKDTTANFDDLDAAIGKPRAATLPETGNDVPLDDSSPAPAATPPARTENPAGNSEEQPAGWSRNPNTGMVTLVYKGEPADWQKTQLQALTDKWGLNSGKGTYDPKTDFTTVEIGVTSVDRFNQLKNAWAKDVTTTPEEPERDAKARAIGIINGVRSWVDPTQSWTADAVIARSIYREVRRRRAAGNLDQALELELVQDTGRSTTVGRVSQVAGAAKNKVVNAVMDNSGVTVQNMSDQSILTQIRNGTHPLSDFQPLDGGGFTKDLSTMTRAQQEKYVIKLRAYGIDVTEVRAPLDLTNRQDVVTALRHDVIGVGRSNKLPTGQRVYIHITDPHSVAEIERFQEARRTGQIYRLGEPLYAPGQRGAAAAAPANAAANATEETVAAANASEGAMSGPQIQRGPQGGTDIVFTVEGGPAEIRVARNSQQLTKQIAAWEEAGLHPQVLETRTGLVVRFTKKDWQASLLGMERAEEASNAAATSRVVEPNSAASPAPAAVEPSAAAPPAEVPAPKLSPRAGAISEADRDLLARLNMKVSDSGQSFVITAENADEVEAALIRNGIHHARLESNVISIPKGENADLIAELMEHRAATRVLPDAQASGATRAPTLNVDTRPLPQPVEAIPGRSGVSLAERNWVRMRDGRWIIAEDLSSAEFDRVVNQLHDAKMPKYVIMHDGKGGVFLGLSDSSEIAKLEAQVGSRVAVTPGGASVTAGSNAGTVERGAATVVIDAESGAARTSSIMKPVIPGTTNSNGVAVIDNAGPNRGAGQAPRTRTSVTSNVIDDVDGVAEEVSNASRTTRSASAATRAGAVTEGAREGTAAGRGIAVLENVPEALPSGASSQVTQKFIRTATQNGGRVVEAEEAAVAIGAGAKALKVGGKFLLYAGPAIPAIQMAYNIYYYKDPNDPYIKLLRANGYGPEGLLARNYNEQVGNQIVTSGVETGAAIVGIIAPPTLLVTVPATLAYTLLSPNWHYDDLNEINALYMKSGVNGGYTISSTHTNRAHDDYRTVTTTTAITPAEATNEKLTAIAKYYDGALGSTFRATSTAMFDHPPFSSDDKVNHETLLQRLAERTQWLIERGMVHPYGIPSLANIDKNANGYSNYQVMVAKDFHPEQLTLPNIEQTMAAGQVLGGVAAPIAGVRNIVNSLPTGPVKVKMSRDQFVASLVGRVETAFVAAEQRGNGVLDIAKGLLKEQAAINNAASIPADLKEMANLTPEQFNALSPEKRKELRERLHQLFIDSAKISAGNNYDTSWANGGTVRIEGHPKETFTFEQAYNNYAEEIRQLNESLAAINEGRAINFATGQPVTPEQVPEATAETINLARQAITRYNLWVQQWGPDQARKMNGIYHGLHLAPIDPSTVLEIPQPPATPGQTSQNQAPANGVTEQVREATAGLRLKTDGQTYAPGTPVSPQAIRNAPGPAQPGVQA